MRRVAFLTSGGDCQALNATMRGVAKTLYNADPDTQIIGILEGYKGCLLYTSARKLSGRGPKLIIFKLFNATTARAIGTNS